MTKRRILIDGTTVSRRIDGLSQYILNVTANLDPKKADYTMIVRPGECPEHFAKLFLNKGIKLETADIAPIGPKRDWQFRKWLKKNKGRFDCAFCPSNQFPVALSIPCVYTIHDIIYEEFPEQLGKKMRLKRKYLQWVVGNGLKKAAAVVAVSEYTKQEILHWHRKTNAEKISVIYEGWEHLKQTIPADYKAPFENYVLYVGSSRAHKNLKRLIEATEILKDRLPAGWGVLIAGNDDMLTEEQQAKVTKINENRKVVYLTGWLTEEELSGCIKNAKLFVFPSLAEGFGIPVLEAYYYHIPLLLSNRASLPEVAGDAAIYIDPYSVKDIAEKIVENIGADHKELIKKQDERLKLYSWQKTAEATEKLLLNI